MRILFCISGIGSGHVSRCRPLLNVLISAGHECSAAVTGFSAGRLLEGICPVTTPPPGYRDRVAPPARLHPPYLLIPDLDSTFSAYQRNATDGLIATLEFFDGVIEKSRPDLVVVDQVLGVGNLASARGVPVVQMTHPPFLPEYGPWATWLEEDPRIKVPPASEVLERGFEAVGRPAPQLDEVTRGELVIIPGHPLFGSCETAVHMRPGGLPGPPDPMGERLSPPHVMVYLSFRAREIGEPVIRGVLDAGCEALIVDGSTYDLPPDLDTHPSIQKLGRVPINEMLSQASAIVHGGGFGIAQEALAAGLPQIMIPRNTEQEMTARRIEALGGGLHISVSSEPMEVFEVSAKFRTLAHISVDRLEPRMAEALEVLLDSGEPGPAALEAGEDIQALPPADELLCKVETLLSARA